MPWAVDRATRFPRPLMDPGTPGGLPWGAPLECYPWLDYGSRGAADAQPGARSQAPHPGYAVSQRTRQRVEEILGWRKDDRAAAQDPAGVRRVGWMFTFATAVYNPIRIRNLTWGRSAHG